MYLRSLKKINKKYQFWNVHTPIQRIDNNHNTIYKDQAFWDKTWSIFCNDLRVHSYQNNINPYYNKRLRLKRSIVGLFWLFQRYFPWRCIYSTRKNILIYEKNKISPPRLRGQNNDNIVPSNFNSSIVTRYFIPLKVNSKRMDLWLHS